MAPPHARIAIITHEREEFAARPYLLRVLADAWRAAGHAVEILRGADRHIEADLAFLHLDLTVVPEPYLALARRYPATVNGHVGDISKRAFSAHLVALGDGYGGPVIVKTDRNYGGRPELELARASDGLGRFGARMRRLLPARLGGAFDPERYPIYPSAAGVPAWVWRDGRLVVQRFLPERRGERYCLRRWNFLGDRHIHDLSVAHGPIVKTANTAERTTLGEPPAELVAARERLSFDFGKFDYGVVEGEVVLYDVNRTPGFGNMAAEAARAQAALVVSELGPGLDGLLARSRAAVGTSA